MAETASVIFQPTLRVNNRIETGEDFSGLWNRTLDIGSDRINLDGNSSPSSKAVWADTVDLVTGEAEINLADLDRGDLSPINGTGFQVVAIKVRAHASNTAAVTLQSAEANGYDLLGSGWKLALSAGATLLQYLPTAPTVGSSARLIELASSDADAKVDILLVLGTP